MLFARRILHDFSLQAATSLLLLLSVASCRPTDNLGGFSSGGAGGGGTGASGGVGGGTPTGTGGGASGSRSTGGALGTGGWTGLAGASGGFSGSGGFAGVGGSNAGGDSRGGAGASGGAQANGGAAGSGGTLGRGGSGASSGAGGAAGSSGVADAAVDTVDAVPPPSRGPTPATAGHAFPFPQNRENSRCIYPKLYRNEDVQAAYAQWKNDTVTSDGAKGFRRVKRPNEPGLEKDSTVSEGIAYGMLIAVYMDDQSLFDDLWQYEQQFLDGKTGLMNWYIKADGSGVGSDPSGAGPAADADEDMAFALVLADKQWGGQGKLKSKYIDLAKAQISSVWNNEVYNYEYLKPWPATDLPALNLSYFAPAFYKVFAKVDTANASNWKKLTDTMYTALGAALNTANGNADNGLVPAWCDTSGKPNAGAFGPTGGASPTNYQYDSCRTPFRIGLDYCWNGDTRAQAYVGKTSGFFSGIGAANIVDGYDLNGTPHAQYQTGAGAQVQSSSFVGPAGVGAMSSPTYQSFLDDAYGILTTGGALVGGTYYDESWMVMSLLMMTANYLDYTSL
jgi:endo-1,4-beta-D-glucanase Y